MEQKIKETLQKAFLEKNKIQNYFLKRKNINKIYKISKKISEKLKSGGKLLLCGNGGSAADAQHLAAEFLVRLTPNKNRKPIPAIPLLLDTSTISACSNDYDYNILFKRNFQALHKKNDVLIMFSTSGNSKNILEVAKFAKKQKIYSVGFYGNLGGKVKKYTNDSIIVPSKITARIQEFHIFLGHIIFEEIEKQSF
tara:strand:- start:201 stop:788 length:588 start_codon:yes stop_codon:yes gene_type:complete